MAFLPASGELRALRKILMTCSLATTFYSLNAPADAFVVWLAQSMASTSHSAFSQN
jgi:hypothetical protein